MPSLLLICALWSVASEHRIGGIYSLVIGKQLQLCFDGGQFVLQCCNGHEQIGCRWSLQPSVTGDPALFRMKNVGMRGAPSHRFFTARADAGLAMSRAGSDWTFADNQLMTANGLGLIPITSPFNETHDTYTRQVALATSGSVHTWHFAAGPLECPPQAINPLLLPMRLNGMDNAMAVYLSDKFHLEDIVFAFCLTHELFHVYEVILKQAQRLLNEQEERLCLPFVRPMGATGGKPPQKIKTHSNGNQALAVSHSIASLHSELAIIRRERDDAVALLLSGSATQRRAGEQGSLFNQIANAFLWQGLEPSETTSLSGPGSLISKTRGVSECLGRWIKDFQIDTVLDLPCGDGAWQHTIPGIDQVGWACAFCGRC
jgi:hypothetical protein